ncbi:unnamed protein product [Eruca vesicaria subsp. sativa]|uniref:Uncharacterized protein n=1 Tax=Eruca vesicaria subsp. sativa TaxID=29727 RepID=A0ABC8K3I5_ERUVS|nr:unnamed protein product [Eruca vesicaria subsp. sativa]
MNNVKDVEAGLPPKDNQCGWNWASIFIGGCGPDGNKKCKDDFDKEVDTKFPYGEELPYSCKCDNFLDKHLCRCNVPRLDFFDGACGPDGNKTCINEVVKKGGEGKNKPSSCECTEYLTQHVCRCNLLPC